jgi:ferritin
MSYLQLPPVHGYGVPQILSQWQAGLDRRQQKDQFQKEFGLREKQFEFQQEQFKEEKAAKNQLRQAKAQDNAFKFIDTGEKYMGDDKTFQTGVSMSDKGYKMLNEIYPGLNIDVSNIVDAKERKKEAQKQMILGLTELHKRAVGGDEKAIALMPGALAGASSAGIDETTLKYLKDFKPEGVGEEAQKQMILGLTELHKRAVGGDEKAIALMPGALAGASSAGIDETTLKYLKDFKPEGVGEEAQKQMILGLTELHKRAVGGDEKAIALMPGALAGASSAGIDETTLKYLKDFKPEGVGEEGKTYQLKIKDLMKQNPELSQQEATGLMTGTIKVMQDPVSGARFVVDTIKGTERQLKPEGLDKQPPKETGTQDKTIFELADLVSGPGSALKAAASVPSGIVGGPVADETLQARQYVVTAKNDLIRALSINPRFPVGEIKRIEQEIDVSPKILDNPKMLKNRLISIDKYLKRRVEKEKGVANDANMPTNARQEAMSSVKDIENFIKLMGVPIQIKSIEEYNTVESGTQYIDPDGKVRTKK